MKILGLVFGIFLMSCSFVYADVDYENLSTVIDDNGNIELHTQWFVDGVEVKHFDRNGNPIQENGKFYWTTRYAYYNFLGMTDAEKLAWIDTQLKAFGEHLIRQDFNKKENQKVKDSGLPNLVGKKGKVTQTDIDVDTNGDGVADKTWTVKTDGTKIEKPITP